MIARFVDEEARGGDAQDRESVGRGADVRVDDVRGDADVDRTG
jgi:hypothetical protein